MPTHLAPAWKPAVITPFSADPILFLQRSSVTSGSQSFPMLSGLNSQVSLLRSKWPLRPELQVPLSYCSHGNSELWPPGFKSTSSSGAAGSQPRRCPPGDLCHCQRKTPAQLAWGKPAATPAADNWSGGRRKAGTVPLPWEQLPESSAPRIPSLPAPAGQSAVFPPSHEVCAQTSHFCPHTAAHGFGSRELPALPLPRQASRACHVPTFTATKKGDPEPGLVGVPSSHSSRRNTSSSSSTLSKKPIASSSSSMAAGGAEGKQEARSTQQQQPLPPPPPREAGGQGGEERAGQA